MRYLCFCAILLSAAIIGSGEAAAGQEAPVRVLVVDGYGNHDWRRTTRLICDILNSNHGFVTEVATAPADPGSDAYHSWKPDFSEYDVVIQTCNDINGGGPLWPEKVRADFESYVSGGGGVFVFHSANNAFAKWEAYNRMIGLGWRDRDFGTAIRIAADGSLVRIPPGEGAPTSHGARTDRVIHRIGGHPVHVGLPQAWMTPLIEVYTHARGPAENLEILSWAEEPTTGERWPVEWTTAYGKGRVYTSTFGHVWQDEKDPVNLRCAGFQTLVVRAVQWLAKREIAKDAPEDFPTAKAVSLRSLDSP